MTEIRGQKSEISIAFRPLLFALCYLALSQPVEAQQTKKIPRIGYLSDSGDPSSPGPQVEAFRRGLRDLGYVEGQNVLVEYRYGQGQSRRYPGLVAELLQLNVDVLVARALPSIYAAKEATKTIPIVMVTTQDPVATGLIDRLARPGGNITGVTTLQRELSGKRLELLKEVLPGISRVGALANAEQLSSNFPDFKWYEASARALKIQLQPLAVRKVTPDLDAAFENAAKGRVNALITISGFTAQSLHKADSGTRYKEPTAFNVRNKSIRTRGRPHVLFSGRP